MSDGFILTILLVMAGVMLFRYYEPKVDIVITGKNSYKVLLWYNNWDFSGGKLISFNIENPEVLEEHSNQPLVVLDDLCDGGGTFVGIAELLNEKCPNRPKSIFVTHAVNYKGIENMSKHYDNVYITNSYKDWDNLPENVTIIDVV